MFDSRNPENSLGGVAVLDAPLRLVSRRRSLDRWSNAELVEAAAAGDRRAWDELVDRYAGLVEAVGVRHRLDRHDINDVSQVTWLRLTQHLHRLHDPERVGLWLHTTARRECLALLARSGRSVPTDQELGPAVDDGPEELLARAEQAHHIRNALRRLPEPCRRLLELILVQDPPAPYAEVSEKCHIAVGTIGPRRQRCLAHLRRLYAEIHPGIDEGSDR